MPTLGLFLERLPADKDVERGLALKNGCQFGLEGTGGAEPGGSARFVGLGVLILLANPVAQVAVGQLLQGGMIELVLIDQDVEAIGTAIPEMPDEGAVVEKLGVLLKKFVTQPVLQGG